MSANTNAIERLFLSLCIALGLLITSPVSAEQNNLLSPEKRIEKANAFYSNLSKGDIHALAALFTEDAIQEQIYAPPGFAKVKTGRDLIYEHWQAVPRVMKSVDYIDRRYHPIDGQPIVFIQSEGQMVVRETGKRYDNNYIHVFHFAGELISRFEAFFDPQVAIRVFGESLASSFNAESAEDYGKASIDPDLITKTSKTTYETSAIDNAAAARAAQNEALVYGWLSALTNQDLTGFAELWTEDVIEISPYVPEGIEPVLSGRDELVSHYEATVASHNYSHYTDVEIFQTIDSDVLWVTFDGETDIVTTGKPYNNHYVVRLTVRDGQIAESLLYFNPLVLAEALQQ